MKLKRPLIVFDFEGTGPDPAKDKIVQICMWKVNPDGTVDKKQKRVNPECIMSDEVIAIHGTTNEMVANKPPFRMFARALYDWISGCDLAGYNIVGYDIPILAEEFHRCGIVWPNPEDRFKVVDAYKTFVKKEPRDLSAAFKFYTGNEPMNAHDAAADVDMTYQVILGQVKMYKMSGKVDDFTEDNDFERAVDPAGKIIRDEKGSLVYNYGRFRGDPVEENMGLLDWMMRVDFPETTKLVCQLILNGEIS